MKIAAKQLLALGVPPQQIVELEKRAEGEGVTLRELVQAIIRDWLHDRRPGAREVERLEQVEEHEEIA